MTWYWAIYRYANFWWSISVMILTSKCNNGYIYNISSEKMFNSWCNVTCQMPIFGQKSTIITPKSEMLGISVFINHMYNWPLKLVPRCQCEVSLSEHLCKCVTVLPRCVLSAKYSTGNDIPGSAWTLLQYGKMHDRIDPTSHKLISPPSPLS